MPLCATLAHLIGRRVSSTYCTPRALIGAVFLIARVPQYPHDRGYAATLI